MRRKIGAFLSRRGKQVKFLKGTAAQKFLQDVVHVDQQEAQLIIARITRNFKRGNER